VAYVVAGAAYLLLYAAIGWSLGGHPLALSLFGHLSLLLPPAAICAVILHRRTRWFGCQRLFWDVFGIGVALWMIGHLGWAFGEVVLGRPSWIQWHTVFSLCGGIGPLIALLARPHRGVRSHEVGSVTPVLASFGLLAVFIYSYFALVPSLVLPTPEANRALFSVVQVNQAVLLVGVLRALSVGWHTDWRRTYAYLAIATTIGFVLRLVTSQAIVSGQYQSGTLYDLVWIAPFVCYAIAALEAPDSPLESTTAEQPSSKLYVAIAAVAVFLIPLAGYGTLYLQPLGDTGDTVRALLTGLMTVAGLGLLTFLLATQGGELERADARLRLLAAAIEQTGDSVLITRANGAFEHANDAFVRAMGYSRRQLEELTFRELLDHFGDGSARPGQELRERGIWRGTIVRQRRDGSTFPASCTIVGLRGAAGEITHVVAVERDITDEVKLRDQLVHQERVSAIGELVAGVAHEINNPLQTIVGSVEVLRETASDEETRRDLDVVRHEALRAGQIVRNLLSFVRPRASDRALVDLNDIVRTTIELRAYHLRQRDVTVALDLQAGGVPVVVNREEIQQVVLNLVLNAEHAILTAARHGSITIRTRSTGNEQLMDVADSGSGVSPEYRGRIFEPFFTTKDVGQGTGLGLSISHGIASAHGGRLELRPSQSGACFRLTLPAPAGPVNAPPAARQTHQAGNGRALIVDDEVPIRKVLARFLERRGFEVLEADGAEAALAVAGDEPLRLVLCDVRTGGLSGVDLCRRFVARDPTYAARFVFMTGDTSSIPDGDEFGDVPVLSKPFSGPDLDDVLARVGVVPTLA
jgi:PAS domain S-box-containing protein